MRERKKLWVQPEVQGAFVLRVALYWVECLLTVFFMTVCWTAWNRPVASSGELFGYVLRENVPVLLAAFLLLPLVVFDTLRTSHRFVGPLVRVRRALRAIAAGQPVEPLTYRESDYWKEFADDVNQVIARFQSLNGDRGSELQPAVDCQLACVGSEDHPATVG